MAITGIIQKIFPKCQHHKATYSGETRGAKSEKEELGRGNNCMRHGKNGKFPALFLLPSLLQEGGQGH